jgi:hypothetical protein
MATATALIIVISTARGLCGLLSLPDYNFFSYLQLRGMTV